MNDEQRVGYDFERLMKAYPGLFKGAVAAIESIVAIGSLKQATEEAERRLVKAQEETAKLDQELAGRKAEAETYVANQKAEGIRTQFSAQALSENIIGEAHRQAATITQVAQADADKLLADANTAAEEYEKRVRAAQDHLETQQTAFEDMTRRLADAKSQLTATQALQADANAALDAVQAKLAGR